VNQQINYSVLFAPPPVEVGFWWSHWGHLLTKPLLSGGIYIALHFRPGFLSIVPSWTPLQAGILAVLLPFLYSLWRKHKYWPLAWLSREAIQDEVADAVAAMVAVLPLAINLPWYWRLGVMANMVFVLWPFGIHKWAKP